MAMAKMVLRSDGPERGRHDDGHDQQRQRLHDVEQALDQEVEPAAEIAAGQADGDADQRPSPMAPAPTASEIARRDDAAVHVAAHEVGTQPELLLEAGRAKNLELVAVGSTGAGNWRKPPVSTNSTRWRSPRRPADNGRARKPMWPQVLWMLAPARASSA
jgi:hypothetical protein